MNSPVFYDLRGLKCPLPVLKLRKKLASLQKGDCLQVETTDPLAGIDIAHFCAQEHHQLLESTKTANGHQFLICKG